MEGVGGIGGKGGNNKHPAHESPTSQIPIAIEVGRLIAAGHRRAVVMSHCCDDRLLARAGHQILSVWDIERPQMVADLLSQLSALQQDARIAGHYAIALGCINEAATIVGFDLACN